MRNGPGLNDLSSRLLATRIAEPSKVRVAGAAMRAPALSAAFAPDPTVIARLLAPVPPPRAELRRTMRAKYQATKGLDLSYAPENVEVYVQAYNGAMAGMIYGRVLSSSLSSTYIEQTLSAGVWAQQFDVLWAASEALDEVQAEGIFLGSMGIWSGRFASSLTASQTTAAIEALIASIAESEIFFSDQGISIPLWNSGSNSGGNADSTIIGTGFANVVTSEFQVYFCDCSGGPVTLEFPAGTKDQLARVEVVVPGGGGNNVTLTSASGNTLLYNGAYTNSVVLQGTLGSGASFQWTNTPGAWV